jgi:hypothetical protein
VWCGENVVAVGGFVGGIAVATWVSSEYDQSHACVMIKDLIQYCIVDQKPQAM